MFAHAAVEKCFGNKDSLVPPDSSILLALLGERAGLRDFNTHDLGSIPGCREVRWVRAWVLKFFMRA
jgi:hypothetical protein